MSLYLGDKLIAGAGTPTLDTRNIGQIVQSAIPLTDAGLHLLDGALLANGSYSAFVTYIAGLVSDYPELFDTEANWQQSVADYGVCGKFVYDSVNNTVRLPKLSSIGRYLIKSYSSGTSWYRIYSDGWCEQGGSFSGTSITFSKEFIDTNYGFAGVGTDGNTAGAANTLNLNYKLTTGCTYYTHGNNGGLWRAFGYIDISSYKVEPLYQYIVIANSTKTEIEVDIDEIATDLNGKADVDLSNVSTTSGFRRLIEVYNNGTSWYKVFNEYNPSTGAFIGKWCEQGGRCSANKQTVTYLKPFVDTNYTVTGGLIPGTSSGSYEHLNIGSLTTTSFYYTAYDSYQLMWQACGYIS